MRRVDRFAGCVPGGSSRQTSHGGPCDRADGTSQSRSDHRTRRGAAGGSNSRCNRLSTRRSCRIEHFTDPVSSRGSCHASYGGSYGRADGTTNERAHYGAGRRTTRGSRSCTERMRTRLLRQVSRVVVLVRLRTWLLRQYSCFFHHEEPPFISRFAITDDTVLQQRAARFTKDSMYRRSDAVQ